MYPHHSGTGLTELVAEVSRQDRATNGGGESCSPLHSAQSRCVALRKESQVLGLR